MSDETFDSSRMDDLSELGRIPGFGLVRETPALAVLDAMRGQHAGLAGLLGRFFGALVRVPEGATPEALERALRTLTLGAIVALWRHRPPPIPASLATPFAQAVRLFGAQVMAFADARRLAAGPAVEIHLLRGVRVKTVLELARQMNMAVTERTQNEFWQYGTFTVGQWLSKSGAGSPSLEARRILGGVEASWLQSTKQAEPLRAKREAAREDYAGPARDTVRALRNLLAAHDGVPVPLESTRAAALERGLAYVEVGRRFEAQVGGTCPAWGWCDVVAVRLEDTSTPSVTCARSETPCSGKRQALELAIDALIDESLPMRGGAMYRADAGVSGEARLLARLDTAIGRARSIPAEDEGRIAWVLTPFERLELVRISERKVGAGFKTKKVTKAEGVLALTKPTHVAALAVLQGNTDVKAPSEREFVALVAPALTILQGDASVYVKTEAETRPLQIHVAEPRIATQLVPSDGGETVRMVLQLDEVTFDKPLEHPYHWLFAFDAANARVTLGHVSLALSEAASVLLRGPPVPLGEGTRARFAEAMVRLARTVPVAPNRAWLGPQMRDAALWTLKLEWAGPRGQRALMASLGLRIAPELGLFTPGEGDRIVPRQRIGPDGVTEVAHSERDLGAELHEGEALAARLGLAVPGNVANFEWHIPALEHALALAGDARSVASEAGVAVVWASKPLSLVRASPGEKLKLRVGFKRDWLDLAGGIAFDGNELPLAQLLAALRDAKRFVALDDARYVELSDELRRALAPLASLARTRGDGIVASRLAAPLMAELQAAGAEIDGPPEWLNYTQRMQAAVALNPELPDGLHAELRPYQVAGFQWAMRLAHWAPGACLADDMGLGKTLQALAVLLARATLGPALVVAPTSVVPNWVREAARFTPSLVVRRAFQGAMLDAALAGLGPGQVLVTTWDLLTRHEARLTRVGAVEALAGAGEAAAGASEAGEVLAGAAEASPGRPWATVILDEAHAIKNPTTKRAQVARHLEAGFTLALTGTPVENRPLELWSLFAVVAPGLLGSIESFREGFARPIEERVPDASQALARLVRPFLLRRTKVLVAPDLPPRTEVRVDVILESAERARYEQIRKSALRELAAAGPDALSGQTGMIRVLAVLTRLRQAACHPQLVDPRAPATSAKLERLMELVEELRGEGRKILVFSQFTELLARVRTAFEASQTTYTYLDGSTPGPAREAAIERFQRGEVDAFLLSLKAGGVGLNLTAATEVIHLDPWWNPSVEDQASDRAHRIGQERPVTIYRLVANGTIEEQILGLHHDKRTMVASLLEGTASARPLAADEMLALLSGEVPSDASA